MNSRSGLGGELVIGRQSVRALLTARHRVVRDVWMMENIEPAPIVDEIVRLAREEHLEVRSVPKHDLEDEAGTDGSQGVIAHAEAVSEADMNVLSTSGPDGRLPFLLVLNNVTDPRNFGALLRTAECAGVTGVVVPRHRSARITPSVTKAAAGAIEYLPIATVSGAASALETLSKAGVWTVGLDADGSHTLFDLELADQPIALVLGAEGEGLSHLVKQRCDLLVSIPQFGSIESLNVGVAGGIAMYEVARRRKA